MVKEHTDLVIHQENTTKLMISVFLSPVLTLCGEVRCSTGSLL